MAGKNEIETRAFKFTELRVDPSAEWPIVGYPAVFESLSEPIWGIFREKIRGGAFAKTIREADVRALFNHDSNYVLGRNRSGTLRLEEDARGLLMRIRPVDAQWAKDLQESMRRGDIDQGSFAFRTIRDEWDQSNPEDVIRTLLEVELIDVSVVTYPAYPETSIKAREAAEEPDSAEASALSEKVREIRELRAGNNGDNGGNTPKSEALRGNGNPDGGLEPAAGDQSARADGGPAGLALKRKWLDLLDKLELK